MAGDVLGKSIRRVGDAAGVARPTGCASGGVACTREVAYGQARTRRLGGGEATRASRRSAALALVDKPELADDDALAYDEAALRVARCAGRRRAGAACSQGASTDRRRASPAQTCVRFAKRRALHLRRGVAGVDARRRRAATP